MDFVSFSFSIFCFNCEHYFLSFIFFLSILCVYFIVVHGCTVCFQVIFFLCVHWWMISDCALFWKDGNETNLSSFFKGLICCIFPDLQKKEEQWFVVCFLYLSRKKNCTPSSVCLFMSFSLCKSNSTGRAISWPFLDVVLWFFLGFAWCSTCGCVWIEPSGSCIKSVWISSPINCLVIILNSPGCCLWVDCTGDVGCP